MAEKFVVLTRVGEDIWQNVWTDVDRHNNIRPTMFDTKHDAEAELKNHLETNDIAFVDGNVVEAAHAEDYRVVSVDDTTYLDEWKLLII